jgi:hypothetical protein
LAILSCQPCLRRSKAIQMKPTQKGIMETK